MSGTNLIATQATLTGLAASSMASASLTPMTLATTTPELYETGPRSTSRYVIAGTTMAALGTVLVGCGEPRPAPIANESTIPPNQSTCAPGSRSPYCQGQREVLAEMQHMREEGHHSDQSLFFISGGLALALGITVGLVVGMKRGRKKAERAAAQQQEVQAQQPPPADQPNGTPKAENK